MLPGWYLLHLTLLQCCPITYKALGNSAEMRQQGISSYQGIVWLFVYFDWRIRLNLFMYVAICSNLFVVLFCYNQHTRFCQNSNVENFQHLDQFVTPKYLMEAPDITRDLVCECYQNVRKKSKRWKIYKIISQTPFFISFLFECKNIKETARNECQFCKIVTIQGKKILFNLKTEVTTLVIKNCYQNRVLSHWTWNAFWAVCFYSFVNANLAHICSRGFNSGFLGGSSSTWIATSLKYCPVILTKCNRTLFCTRRNLGL